MKKFLIKILSASDDTSSKRLITLILAFIFILAQFVILFIAFYVIFYTTRGKVDKDLIDLLKTVLEYDFYIILSGLGFITADMFGRMMVEKVRARFGGGHHWGGGFGGGFGGGSFDLPPYRPITEEDDEQPLTDEQA